LLDYGQMDFTIVGELTEVSVIARGRSIRRLATLMKRYGGKNWRKMKGFATVRTITGSTRWAEVHWYEAHGVGRKGWKIKQFLD
jgi:hypothetical protein